LAKRILTNYKGVYQRISEVRLNYGRKDICFDISYTIGTRLKWEKIGWMSEGYTAKLASEIRSERLRAIRHGTDIPNNIKAPFFRDIALEYLKWARVNKISACDDEGRYKNHLSHRFDKRRLNEISVFDLERMKKELLNQGLAPSTTVLVLALFRGIFNKAIAWGLYNGLNPMKGVKIPKLNNQRERFLSYDEADMLLDELAKSSQDCHDMALLSLHSGLRAGEIFNLKGQDLDFENELISVSDPKNNESRKTFMTKSVKEMLQMRMPESPNEFIFKDHRKDGKVNSISQTFRKVVFKLGFNQGIADPRKKITFHNLRHTFASWLAISGEPILIIKELLGHKSIAMTLRYAHLIPDQKRQAILNLESRHRERILKNS
jgi:integrase